MGDPKNITRWLQARKINLEKFGKIILGDKMNNNVEKWVLEDGRKAEKIVTESKLNENEVERTIEIKVEEERPLNVQQRIIEKTKPFVYERRIETINTKTGEVIDQRVETIDPQAKMHTTENNDVNYVTKNEMVDAIVAAIKSIKEKDSQSEVKSLGMVDKIRKVNEPYVYSVRDIVLSVIILVQVFGLAYLITVK